MKRGRETASVVAQMEKKKMSNDVQAANSSPSKTHSDYEGWKTIGCGLHRGMFIHYSIYIYI